MSWGAHLSKNTGRRAFTYTLAIPILLYYSLSLTGCISTSPGIPELFLVQVYNPSQNNTVISLRYLGICSISTATRVCSSTFGTSAESLSGTLQVPQALVQYGLDLQGVSFPVLLAAAGTLFLLGFLTFLLLKGSIRREYTLSDTSKMQSTTRRIAWQSKVAWGLIHISIGLSLAVAYATTTTTAGLELATSSESSATIVIAKGKALETLQWLITGLSTLFALGIYGIINPSSSGGLPAAETRGAFPARIGGVSAGPVLPQAQMGAQQTGISYPQML